MEEFNEEEIKRILNIYAKKRNREKNYYQDKNKNNEEFQKKNRIRAKKHYQENKEKKKLNYEENKELRKNKQLFKYYKKLNRLDDFNKKYPEKSEFLKLKGIN